MSNAAPGIDPQVPQSASADNADEPLAHLYKMSTTSAGGQEYVAINPTAIAALLLGVASVLALVSDVLLIVPLAGVVCAVIALMQIRRSNGTQTGISFAIAGFCLALLIGGARAAQQVIESTHNSRDTQAIVELMDRFGQDMHTARHREAYEDLMTAAFREQVDYNTFVNSVETLEKTAGQIQSCKWNREQPQFEEVGTTGVRGAYAMGLLQFSKMKDPGRPVFSFSDREGTWKIDGCSIFPERKKKKALQ